MDTKDKDKDDDSWMCERDRGETSAYGKQPWSEAIQFCQSSKNPDSLKINLYREMKEKGGWWSGLRKINWKNLQKYKPFVLELKAILDIKI